MVTTRVGQQHCAAGVVRLFASHLHTTLSQLNKEDAMDHCKWRKMIKEAL